jgi:membrane-bound metal-dependent hydrolase YbcI (DUF457 family)
MLLRTHLAITLFFALILLSYVQNPIIFLAISLIATAIPDIDSRFSKIGHYKIFRIFNFFTKHRGIIHSFTFLFVIFIFGFLFFKELIFPFLLGYGLHLIADSFTLNGIRPFYPLKFRLKGIIRTGGLIEIFIFIIFVLANCFLIFKRIFNIF